MNPEQIQKMPMQELIEHLEQQAGVVASEDYRLALEDVISWCNKHFLEKQKQSDEQKDKEIVGKCLRILEKHCNFHAPVIEYFNKCHEEISQLLTK